MLPALSDNSVQFHFPNQAVYLLFSHVIYIILLCTLLMNCVKVGRDPQIAKRNPVFAHTPALVAPTK